MSGYTLSGVAGRVRDLETKTNGAYYVALCWLAMCRDSGKGAKKRLADKVFGIGKDVKETSTFRNAWRIADKAFAEGFPAEKRKAVIEQQLDDAVDYAVATLEAHKLALGVTNMKDYEEVCKYASKEAQPPKVEEETPTTPPAEPEQEPTAPVDNVDVVANIRTAITTLTLEQAMKLAGWLATHINAAQAVSQKQAA